MIIEDTGWYEEGKKGGEPILVANDEDELIKYLDGEGVLDDMVTEYICSEFDMSDFIREKMKGCEYMNREDMIESFKDNEIRDRGYFNLGNGKWLYWYEKGEDTEEVY